jgi:hypothetical protein
MSRKGKSRKVMSRKGKSRKVMSRKGKSRKVMSRKVMSRKGKSRKVMSRKVMSRKGKFMMNGFLNEREFEHDESAEPTNCAICMQPNEATGEDGVPKSIILHCDERYGGRDPHNHEYHILCLREQIKSGLRKCSLCIRPIKNIDIDRLFTQQEQDNLRENEERRQVDEQRRQEEENAEVARQLEEEEIEEFARQLEEEFARQLEEEENEEFAPQLHQEYLDNRQREIQAARRNLYNARRSLVEAQMRDINRRRSSRPRTTFYTARIQSLRNNLARAEAELRRLS